MTDRLDSAPASSRISCVICACGEAPRISEVLAIVAGHPLIDEVVVVDDGCADAAAEIARGFPQVRVVACKDHRGKSAAMAAGAAAARHDLLMLLDADLKGLTEDDVTALALPVLDGVADVTLSLRRNSLGLFRAIGLDFVSGERVLRRALLAEALAEAHRLPRFGIEVVINRRIISERLPIAVVRWPRVTCMRRNAKHGFGPGLRAECRTLIDLLRAVYPLELAGQSLRMLALRARATT